MTTHRTHRTQQEQPIPQTTPVIVRRTVKSFDETNEHGPMTIAEAEKSGLGSTSSGTVRVVYEVAPGHELAGANVVERGSKWVAQWWVAA